MKSFGVKPWMLPQPVLIIGTYNEDGTPNAMNAAWGGQWDRGEIMVSMGAHATTENLARCADFTVAFATKDTMVASDFVGIVSAKNVNGNQKCSDFGNSECSILGIKTTVLLASTVQ